MTSDEFDEATLPHAFRSLSGCLCEEFVKDGTVAQKPLLDHVVSQRLERPPVGGEAVRDDRPLRRAGCYLSERTFLASPSVIISVMGSSGDTANPQRS